MKLNKTIKKSTSILLYVIVLYYLLPFRPLYIYYTSLNNTSQEYFKQDNKTSNAPENSGVFTSELNYNKDTFPQKEKVRFFFDSFFIVSPHYNSVVSFTKEEIHSYLKSTYQNPLVYYNSGRGPPIV